MMNEFELLMENAVLRNEIEPYLDESFYLVDLDQMSTRFENEYLSSLLAWEKAPSCPFRSGLSQSLSCRPTRN